MKRKDGKKIPTFRRSEGYTDLPKMELACGTCDLCRETRLRDIALRCVHEAQTHSQSSVLTCTYAPEHMPPGGKLNPKDWSILMKRVRRLVNYPIRALAVGEYGPNTNRPHIHALLFGIDFLGDARPIGPEQNQQYTSKILDDLWGKGHVRLGRVTSASAAYVAGYCLKKIESTTGQKETFSYPKRPPLGRGWYDKYLEQMARLGHVTLNGNILPIPQKYFEWDAEENNVLQKWKDKNMEYAQNAALGISEETRLFRAKNKALVKKSRRSMKKGHSI